MLVFLGDAGLSLRWAGEDITLTLSGAVGVRTESAPTIESMLKASLGLLLMVVVELDTGTDVDAAAAAAEELLLTKGLVGAMGSMLNV